jgi:hypothetical protein
MIRKDFDPFGMRQKKLVQFVFRAKLAFPL